MRTLVQGAVDDHRTRIVLDTGANVSVITNTFAKKLRLRDIPDHGRSIDIQGISEGKVSTTRRALARSRSGGRWSTSSRSGIRLDLFYGAAQLPNEGVHPAGQDEEHGGQYGTHVNAGPSEALDVPDHESREYRLAKRAVRLESMYCGFDVQGRSSPYVPAIDRLAMVVPVGDLPRGEG
ncbi:hypothetical protein F441_17580 [Phytophthora nicotianae CJ01A1]|uniref:Peptidase A2 domain-containing protein n=1 Tax=Phytophthora nicotianae CJ01A1 TaxID=1317063 RepID=W2W8M3_PHYNI|nr:hypothetical protein F441_17580 [Phytophthora nicotianae CJ01A1]